MDQANAKMTYVKDLGIDALDFWVQGQQDAGANLFRTLDPATDPAFQAFLGAANLTTTRWMVLGFNNAQVEANTTAFTTLTNNNVVATQTASFDRMKSLEGSNFTTTQTSYVSLLTSLNIATVPAQIKITTHNSLANGSSLASKNDGNSTYFDKTKGFQDLQSPGGDGDCILFQKVCAGNPLGVSSWFYRLSPVLTDPTDPTVGIEGSQPVIVDEFDNLTADGYWGLIKDPNSAKYILSYTLAGANPKSLTSTDAGRLRLSTIDYSAESGAARLIGILPDDVALQGAVTAVPEPQTWGLMLGGLAVLGGLRRVRRVQQA
ncbi:MAG: PEP-CTERM sorting domain-containing protein [Burkholderiales bacterium]|nr:MAG: PEP-CTERM sorting domain-containing protein [Burkholderiales bacterium]